MARFRDPSASVEAADEKFILRVVIPPFLDMYDFCWSALPALPLLRRE